VWLVHAGLTTAAGSGLTGLGLIRGMCLHCETASVQWPCVCSESAAAQVIAAALSMLLFEHMTLSALLCLSISKCNNGTTCDVCDADCCCSNGNTATVHD